MSPSLQRLSRYEFTDGREGMLNRIVTGDKSWVRHYEPESKPASMHESIPVHLQPRSLRLRRQL
jgi:hypothetical protein